MRKTRHTVREAKELLLAFAMAAPLLFCVVVVFLKHFICCQREANCFHVCQAANCEDNLPVLIQTGVAGRQKK